MVKRGTPKQVQPALQILIPLRTRVKDVVLIVGFSGCDVLPYAWL